MRARSSGNVVRGFLATLLALLLTAFEASGSSLEDASRRHQNIAQSQHARPSLPNASSSYASAKRIAVSYTPAGFPRFADFPSHVSGTDAELGFVDQNGNHLELTLDPVLQASADQILQKNAVPWGALVAIDPKTGKILALAGHSAKEPNSTNVALRGSFPAASLFKMITAAAAVERTGMEGDDIVRFRGSNYTLGPSNFMPCAARDSRKMSLAEAMGKSCNPVFARVALNKLSDRWLAQYAANFGFNSRLPFEAPVEPSKFAVGGDSYSLARTAAGFGEVQLSPLHAAIITGAIANNGEMMRPFMVSRVVDGAGNLRYQGRPSQLKRAVTSSTAGELMNMMVETVDSGTARKQFRQIRSKLPTYEIAAKTGTLTGEDPKGLYTWFVAAAPVSNPEIAMAALVIDPGNARVRGSALGRQFMEQYLSTRGLLNPSPITSEPKVRVAKAPKKGNRVLASKRSRRSAVQVARYKQRKSAVENSRS